METLSGSCSTAANVCELAGDNIMRYGALRPHPLPTGETGGQMAQLGTAEMAEGEARLGCNRVRQQQICPSPGKR